MVVPQHHTQVIAAMDHYFSENPNPNYSCYGAAAAAHDMASAEFVLSDYLALDDVVDHHQAADESWSQSTETESSDKAAASYGGADPGGHGLFGDATSSTNNNNNIECKSGANKRNKVEEDDQVNPRVPRVTFRTRSKLEVMDDGYKWRKYGKKSVKNNPNLRNYYKCSGDGCSVKKRVERDRDDSSYVLTTYDGIHNHESPCTSYYDQMSLVHSNVWPV